MSRHSDLVAATTEAVAARLRDLVTEEVAASLVGAGKRKMWIVPYEEAPSDSSLVPAELLIVAKTLVDGAGIDDLREAEVSVLVSGRNRVLRCVVGDTVLDRMMSVADVTVRARIRTRWVHMWNDAQAVRQWAAEQAGA